MLGWPWLTHTGLVWVAAMVMHPWIVEALWHAWMDPDNLDSRGAIIRRVRLLCAA